MQKQIYETPRTQSVILLQRELFCASNVEGTFTNEGYRANEEEFTW